MVDFRMFQRERPLLAWSFIFAQAINRFASERMGIDVVLLQRESSGACQRAHPRHSENDASVHRNEAEGKEVEQLEGLPIAFRLPWRVASDLLLHVGDGELLILHAMPPRQLETPRDVPRHSSPSTLRGGSTVLGCKTPDGSL